MVGLTLDAPIKMTGCKQLPFFQSSSSLNEKVLILGKDLVSGCRGDAGVSKNKSLRVI